MSTIASRTIVIKNVSRVTSAGFCEVIVMEYDPQVHRRRSIRLASYDYSKPGAYFVMTCAQNRRCLFGEVAVDGTTVLNAAGCLVVEEWEAAAAAYPQVECDASVVMPNHFHGIVMFTDTFTGHVGAIHESPLPSPGERRGMGLVKLMGRFKMRSSKRINLLHGICGSPVWQRNYYEHIIRDEADWNRIREYIETNPAHWAEDRENPLVKTEKK